jgi:glutaryl-CoA dehydrogenase
MVTTAVEDGDGYVLNGAKMWITSGSAADVAVVWAKLAGEIHGFLVERDREGFEARLMKHKLSMRASDTSELILSDCRIPKANRLPTTGGIRYPLSCLKQARYGIAWGVLGAAMACLHEAIEYSKDRIQFGKPIGAFQLTQKKLADMATEISLAQLLCLQLGRLKDDGIADFVQVSLAKRNNVRKALEIARQARTILGANGISGEYQCMRHAANLESVDTYEGTYEIHTLILGNRLTGIEAYE